VKFKIQQSELGKALANVASIVPAKTTMPILTCILVNATEDTITFSATNLDLSVTTKTTEATIETPGKVAIPAQKFVSFVKSLYQGEVVVEVDNNNLSVKCGKAGLTESVMNVDEFPALPETGDNEGHKINTDLLSSMIKSTAYAVSKDETRPALMGILWEIKPTSLAMIATDAHRLSKVEASFDWGVTEIKDIITDTAGLLHFARLAEGEKEGTVFINDKQLSFQTGNTVLHTRLHDGPFPDYTAVIPQGNNMKVIADRDQFMSGVRRVSITADRITSQIRIGLDKGKLEMSATGTDGSKAQDEMAVSFDGDAMEIGFNYSYLLDVLKNIDAEEIEISVKDSQSAALLAPVSEDKKTDLLCLLMPLRLSSD
jgi:DNA polymerase III subunit beta